MSTGEVDVKVEPDDVDASVAAFVEGAVVKLSCPIARVLQGLYDRPVVVFVASWHLGARDKVPATKGVALPAQAVAFIAAFDLWAMAVRSRVRRGDSIADAIVATPGRPGGFAFTVAVPE